MNFNDAKGSAELVLLANQVPLLVGETGIGKSSLARTIANQEGWALEIIDGNLLKEGEIGGLPTVQEVTKQGADGSLKRESITVYAVHHTLSAIDRLAEEGRKVLLFIDEINRCEHSVQQELMNLILNREINGYKLPDSVAIMAAMNPDNEFDYQTVDMDAAQKNRFVWLYMEADYMQWLDWAMEAKLDPKVIEFISTYPDYLYKHEEGGINATPRSYERVSQLYQTYKAHEGRFTDQQFEAVVRGNVGDLIAKAFVAFLKRQDGPLIAYEDLYGSDEAWKALPGRLEEEKPTRIYVATKHIMKRLEGEVVFLSPADRQAKLERFIDYLKLCPMDLMVAAMKDMAQDTPHLYTFLMAEESFVNAYYEAVI